MSTIKVVKLNEVDFKIICEPGVFRELKDHFTFTVPNFKFMNAYRFGGWDGKISMIHLNKKTLKVGLLERLKQFCKDNKYEIEVDPELSDSEFSLSEAQDFFKTLNAKFEPKDYQIDAFVQCIRKNRGLFVSPTASGKSFIIYMLSEYFSPLRKLIIVPTINLVNQMRSDFIDYDLDKCIGDDIQIIKGGETKKITANIVISTWQSIYKMPQEWFDQFGVVVGDEAHLCKADSLTKIADKLVNCKYRFGFTGTLSGMLTDQLVIEGSFGSTYVVTTTKKLMDTGDVSTIKVKSIVLNYPEEIRKSVKGGNYADEIRYLFSNSKRNNFIKNLALSLKGNTLITFSRVEEHGIPLFELIKNKADVPCYLVHGKIDGEEREDIRKIINTHKDSITCASIKTFSTGVNIPELDNIIFASPSKSRITVMQSIGRTLRKTERKNKCTLFDISDNLSYKKWRNYTLLHHIERVKMYISEELEYKIYEVEIK